MDYKTIMAEFEETFNHEEDVSVSAKRKQFIGVSKLRNKWRARIQHPKLKLQVHLGCYSTPEEAALVVKNKKAEFEGTLKAEDSLSVRSCKDKLDEKLPRGVSKRKSGKFRVKIWHPELKRCASFGTYSTVEEAAVVADRKRAELRELYVGKPRGGHVDNDKVLQDCKSESAGKFECLNEQTTCSLEFDEAVSAGFINEYGQLMGKYRELDEQLWLGLPDENFTASTGTVELFAGSSCWFLL